MRISDWSSDVCSSDLNCRIGLHLLFAEQIAEPAAQRRQVTMQAGRLAPGTALAAEPVADQMRVDLFDACDMRGRAIAGELIEIASRGGDGMDRVALFITQIVEIADRKSTRLNSSH